MSRLEEHYLLLKELAERRAAQRSDLAGQYLDKANEIARVISKTRELALDLGLRVLQEAED